MAIFLSFFLHHKILRYLIGDQRPIIVNILGALIPGTENPYTFRGQVSNTDKRRGWSNTKRMKTGQNVALLKQKLILSSRNCGFLAM